MIINGRIDVKLQGPENREQLAPIGSNALNKHAHSTWAADLNDLSIGPFSNYGWGQLGLWEGAGETTWWFSECADLVVCIE